MLCQLHLQRLEPYDIWTVQLVKEQLSHSSNISGLKSDQLASAWGAMMAIANAFVSGAFCWQQFAHFITDWSKKHFVIFVVVGMMEMLWQASQACPNHRSLQCHQPSVNRLQASAAHRSTRPFSAMMRAFSSRTVGLWSLVKATASKLAGPARRPSTQRESPTQAVASVVPLRRDTTAVEPLNSQSMRVAARVSFTSRKPA